MNLTNETLMAYADGELDGETRAAIEAAMAADPAVAQQIARFKAQRDTLRRAFDGVLTEPVPERLIATARTAPTAARETNVVQLRKKSARRWAWPEWGAMAASLLIGLLLGKNMLFPSNDSPIATQDGRLVAQGSLAQALSQQIAGEDAASGAVRVALSFRDRSGDYCRTFVLQDDSGLTGLACHEREGWHIQMLTSGKSETADSTRYRMAGTALPESVLQTVEQRIVGEPLDAAGEAAARRNGWQPGAKP